MNFLRRQFEFLRSGSLVHCHRNSTNQIGSLNAGILNINDTPEWEKFGVWQDLDQDGEMDAGEFRTLAEAGITSLTLATDGVELGLEGSMVCGHSSSELTGNE